jgi:hypothetical protein
MSWTLWKCFILDPTDRRQSDHISFIYGGGGLVI